MDLRTLKGIIERQRRNLTYAGYRLGETKLETALLNSDLYDAYGTIREWEHSLAVALLVEYDNHVPDFNPASHIVMKELIEDEDFLAIDLVEMAQRGDTDETQMLDLFRLLNAAVAWMKRMGWDY